MRDFGKTDEFGRWDQLDVILLKFRQELGERRDRGGVGMPDGQGDALLFHDAVPRRHGPRVDAYDTHPAPPRSSARELIAGQDPSARLPPIRRTA
jgi:hypothetical protein